MSFSVGRKECADGSSISNVRMCRLCISVVNIECAEVSVVRIKISPSPYPTPTPPKQGTSKSSKPKISRTPMEKAVFGRSMIPLSFFTSQPKSQAYNALLSASLESTAWATFSGVVKVSFLVPAVRFTRTFTSSTRDTPISWAACSDDTAHVRVSKIKALAYNRDVPSSNSIEAISSFTVLNLMLPRCRISAITRKTLLCSASENPELSKADYTGEIFDTISMSRYSPSTSQTWQHHPWNRHGSNLLD